MAKLTETMIVTRLREDIDAAEEVALQESRENANTYKFYRGKSMGNEIKGRSQIVSTDTFETVEWALPALMDIFEPAAMPEFEPQGVEDEEPAKRTTQLVRYQFWRLNDGETVLRRAIKDALLYRPGGVIKYCWEKEVENEPKSYEGLSGEELAGLAGDPSYNLKGATETPYGYDVEAEFKVIQFDGPRIYNVPPWEFLRHPNSTDIKDSPFIAHKKKVTVDYLRRMGKAGYFENVEKAVEDAENPAPDETQQQVFVEDGYNREEEKSNDKARQEVDLYECYVHMDVDGDGLLENRIIFLVGTTIVRNVENVYKYPPFICLRGIEDTHKFSGITIAEMMADLQKLRTFLLRQMVDNMAQANNTRKVYDPTRISHADLMNNVVGAAIRTTRPGVDVRTAIMELPAQPVNPVTFNVLEYVTALGEQRTGISKSFKGISDQYQTTASGQFQSINMASQRIRMIAKIFGTAMSDLFRAFVFMNKKFMTEAVTARFDNKTVEITPDDLEGRMDLQMNIFLGAATRQQKVVNLQQVLAILGQLQQIGIPVIDAANGKEFVTEIISAMELKGPERFLPLIWREDSETANQLMQQQQMQQAMLQGQGGAGGATIGSTAGSNGGSSATPNPSGAGVGIAANQPYSGSMVPGYQ